MKDTPTRITVDGCTAAAYVAYALSDVATVYPITPIASMGETAQEWASQGRLNYMSQTMEVKEMESELGAAGATHGALAAGALATTFTSSQGLMLMIPNMYKISGEMLPAVFHVGTRSLATHALSIFGDHQDVMACRATGFAFLASSSVQETMDLALVAHLAALEGSLPVCHFFDGWRTSNQIDTIEPIAYEDMYQLINREALERFRNRALNPEHPVVRGSAQNADVYFQNREAPNRWYDAFPGVVQKYMDKVGELTGRHYHLFDYEGDPQATDALVIIGSAGEVIEQALSVLNGQGYKAGVVKVRLYRPFNADALMAAIPSTVKRLTVLDRTKEPGADGEPLYKDVVTALARAGRTTQVFGGRYGLSSKEFDPGMVKAVFDNMLSSSPKYEFTVGITDDVTHLSLPSQKLTLSSPAGALQAKFYGFGSDGTVGATKQVASVLASANNLYAQAFFQYSAKKSGGYTISQLRLSSSPVKADYDIEEADYVACHKASYVRKYALADSLRQGGVFVLNSPWNTADEWERQLPSDLRRALALKQATLYNIDAAAIAAKYGLGVRINMIMEAVFLHLTDSRINRSATLEALKQAIHSTYIHEGQDVVTKNLQALSQAADALMKIECPDSWAADTELQAVMQHEASCNPMNTKSFVHNIAKLCDRLQGDELPVSVFTPDGTLPMGTTGSEKRRVALQIPQWQAEKCVECALCSLVCAHAAIRPFLMTESQLQQAPTEMSARPAHGLPQSQQPLNWRIQVFAEDCVGCGSCAYVCPGRALTMVSAAPEISKQIPLLEYCLEKVGYHPGLLPRFSVRGSQLYQPLLQFSGACGGCGETPYVKLLTQLFGERMVIANATGCSSIWGADYPSNAYCVNSVGKGPAWGNSLFEDNAEYGYGMAVAIGHRRNALLAHIREAAADKKTSPAVAEALNRWLEALSQDAETACRASEQLVHLLKNEPQTDALTDIINRADMLAPKSVWAIGGDGWAYDIGFAGLDHVLARNTKINLLVMDTECYSNTGGQMSKATPIGAVAAYAPEGKRTLKKDLGRMMMSYGTIYVASISLGANPQQAIMAMKEAEAYPGPSLILAYCPCINHGIRAGMSTAMGEEKRAVQAGYWPLYRYNPLLSAEGKNPLTVDSKAPDGSLASFLASESRYESLREKDASLADSLQECQAKRQSQIYRELSREAANTEDTDVLPIG